MVDIVDQLQTLALSAVEIQELTGWPDEMTEDYLNILRNIIITAAGTESLAGQVESNTGNIQLNTDNINDILAAYLKSLAYSGGVSTFVDQDDVATDIFTTQQSIVLRMGAVQSVDSATKTAIYFNSSIKDPVFTHVDGVSGVTVEADGRYRIQGYIGISATSSNYRYTGQTQIYIDGAPEPTEIESGYIRVAGGSESSSLLVGDTLDLTAGQKIEIFNAKVSTVAGNGATELDKTWIEITRIQ